MKQSFIRNRITLRVDYQRFHPSIVSELQAKPIMATLCDCPES